MSDPILKLVILSITIAVIIFAASFVRAFEVKKNPTEENAWFFVLIGFALVIYLVGFHWISS